MLVWLNQVEVATITLGKSVMTVKLKLGSASGIFTAIKNGSTRYPTSSSIFGSMVGATEKVVECQSIRVETDSATSVDKRCTSTTVNSTSKWKRVWEVARMSSSSTHTTT